MFRGAPNRSPGIRDAPRCEVTPGGTILGVGAAICGAGRGGAVMCGAGRDGAAMSGAGWDGAAMCGAGWGGAAKCAAGGAAIRGGGAAILGGGAAGAGCGAGGGAGGPGLFWPCANAALVASARETRINARRRAMSIPRPGPRRTNSKLSFRFLIAGCDVLTGHPLAHGAFSRSVRPSLPRFTRADVDCS
jgi:hypothetical protein